MTIELEHRIKCIREKNRKLFILYYLAANNESMVNDVFLELKKDGISNKRGVRKHFKELKENQLIEFNKKTLKYKVPNDWKTFNYIEKVFDYIKCDKKSIWDFFRSLYSYFPEDQRNKIIEFTVTNNSNKLKILKGAKKETKKAKDLGIALIDSLLSISIIKAVMLNNRENNAHIQMLSWVRSLIIDQIEDATNLIDNKFLVSSYQRYALYSILKYTTEKLPEIDKEIADLLLNNPSSNTTS